LQDRQSNGGSVLHLFRNTVAYWSKIVSLKNTKSFCIRSFRWEMTMILSEIRNSFVLRN